MSVSHWQEFTCASCTSPIAPTDPRVRCLVCTITCDMCANCVLGERFKEPHHGTHTVQVLKQSGVAGGPHPEGSATVPTVLGSTAICYYPPPPVPTLPPAVGNEAPVHDQVDVLGSSLAQLALGPEGESVSAGGVAGQGRDADGTHPQPLQAPMLQEQHRHLSGQDQDVNGDTGSPPAQLPEGQSQLNDFMAFLAQNQAVPPQYHGKPSQEVNHAVTAAIVSPANQHAPSSVEPLVDSSQRVDQFPTTTPGHPIYQYGAPTASSPAGAFQQMSEQPVTVTAPSVYHNVSSVASPPPSSFQQADHPQAGIAAPSTHPQTASVASPAPGPYESPKVDERQTVVATSPTYYSPAQVTSYASPSPLQHESPPPSMVPGYTSPVMSSLIGASQQVDLPSNIHGSPAMYQPAEAFASSTATSGLQDRPSDDAAIPSTYQPSAAGYVQPVSQLPTAAASATHQNVAPVASSPMGSAQQVDQASVSANAHSFYPRTTTVGSPMAGYAQPTSSSIAPLTYHIPAQAASSPAISSQQIDQPPVTGAASSTYYHGAPVVSTPAGSFQQMDQPSAAAAAPATYQHGPPVALSSVSSFQQAGQPPIRVATPSMYQSAAPVGSPEAIYSQPGPQPASGAAAPPAYQSPVSGAFSASGAFFQPGNQPSITAAAPSAYQPVAAALASSATGYAQPAPQLPTSAAAPSPYQQGMAVAPSPVSSFRQSGRPPSVASGHSTYQYASQGMPPLAGSPSIPPNFTGTPPTLPPRRSTGRPSSHGSPYVAPGSNLPQYQNGYTVPPPSGPTGWQPFFLADMSPSPTFIELMNDVFGCLDQRNLGNLEPEVFSGFLDDLGYLPQENAWKLGLQPTYALSAKSMADKSLKNAFDLFSIEHILLKRVQPPHEDPTGITAQYKRILGSAFNPSMLQNAGSAHSTIEGPMPAIMRKGFIDIMALEAKGEPSREWGNWSRLLRKYNLPRYANWGDLPRECFLEYPDPLTLSRVAEIRKISERQGQEQLDAARAYSQLAAQGRQNALDLIGDTRYKYVYR